MPQRRRRRVPKLRAAHGPRDGQLGQRRRSAAVLSVVGLRVSCYWKDWVIEAAAAAQLRACVRRRAGRTELHAHEVACAWHLLGRPEMRVVAVYRAVLWASDHCTLGEIATRAGPRVAPGGGLRFCCCRGVYTHVFRMRNFELQRCEPLIHRIAVNSKKSRRPRARQETRRRQVRSHTESARYLARADI